jgi:hypothetical protein
MLIGSILQWLMLCVSIPEIVSLGRPYIISLHFIQHGSSEKNGYIKQSEKAVVYVCQKDDMV